jgi:hypothetical protein
MQRVGNRKLLALFLLAVLVLPVALAACSPPSVPFITAQEGTCIDDVTGRINNCTASDVHLGTFHNIEDIECVSGEMVEVFLRADLVAGSKERFDIGMFVAEDGGDARTGTCHRDYLPPPLADEYNYNPGEPLPGPDGGPFLDAEIDEDPDDECGDLEQGVHNYYDLAPDTGITVPCIDSNGDGTLDISACTSWDNQKTTTCLDVEDAIPSTKAKCRCESIEVGNVIVLPGEIQVSKAAVPDNVPEPGGDVVFTFGVENTSEVVITIDSLVDTIYDDLTSYPGGTCTVPQVLAPVGQPGSSYTCSITAFVGGEPHTQTNTVTATGVDENGNDVTDSATEQVLVTDVLPAIDVVKDVDPSSVAEPGGTVLYTVSVTNDSGASDPLTLTSLMDDIYGDLTDDGNPDISNSTCELVMIVPGDTYQCTFEAEVTGNVGDMVADTVTGAGEDDEGNSVSDSDTAEVVITDVPPAIDVVKDVEPSSVAEPGGTVLYTVNVTNGSGASDPLTLTSLMDDVYGDLTDDGNPDISNSTCELVTIAPGDTYACTFEAGVTGNVGDVVLDTVTGTGEDDEGNSVNDSDTAEVVITDVLPAIDTVKTVDPVSIAEPGGTVLYAVSVTNESGDGDPLMLTSLMDDVYGDLTAEDNPDISNSTCELVTIQPGATYQCTFNAEVTGSAGDTVVDTVTAAGQDDEGNSVFDSDTAQVVITDVLPVVDLIKTVDPTFVIEPGGTVVYTVFLTNNSGEGDSLVLISLMDDVYGDLTDDGNPDISDSTCELVTIEPGVTYECTFGAEVTGSAGDSVTDTVTAIAQDEEGTQVLDAGDATVTIVWEPPDTGVDVPAPVIAGGLALAGLVLLAAGVVVRRRSRPAG